MSIALPAAPGKPNMPSRLQPSIQEGQYIRFRLNLAGKKLAEISRELGIHQTNTRKVICGLRRSRRIESEIARILGKAGWNEVVLEARSEVQKKPVEVILDEMRQAQENRRQAQIERMGEKRKVRLEEVDKFVREGLAAIEQRKLGRAAGRGVTA